MPRPSAAPHGSSSRCGLPGAPAPGRRRYLLHPPRRRAIVGHDQGGEAGGTMTASRLRHVLAICILAALHLGALGVMFWSEPDLIGKAAFLLAWGVFNALWFLL